MIGAVQRIPPAFLLAVIVQVLVVALRVALLVAGKIPWMTSASWALVAQGTSIVTVALLAAGAFDLARRTSSPAAEAARAAGIVFTVAVGLDAAGVLLNYIQMSHDGGPFELLFTVESYLWSAVMIGGFAALITACDGWRRAPALAVVAIVTIVISRGPPVLLTPIYEALHDAIGRIGASITLSLIWLVALGATVALVAGTHRVEPSEDGLACERGLRRTSSAMWLRVIASGALVVVAVFAGGMSFIKFVMVAAPVLNAFALASFALGAFMAARSGVRDYSAFGLYAAGALSLWSAGAMLAQAPWLYWAYYRPDRNNDYGLEIAQALGMAIPLVASAGIVVLTIAIAGFARRRSLQDLRDQTTVRAGIFVALTVLSMLIGVYGLPKARTEGTVLAMGLVIAVAGLVATVMVAKLFSLAANEIAQAPGLPVATAREP